jgi:hypothetical protein
MATRAFRRSKAAVLLGLAMTAAPAQALAAPSSMDDAGPTNVDVLMKELTREVESLSVADCTLSCKALASMERARDRICELAPGARCDEARAKVASAQEKVAAACPSCAVNKKPEPAPPPADAKASAHPVAEGTSVQAERERGGCASCRIAGAPRGGVAGDATLLVLATVALRRLTRRRRNG